MKRLYTFITYVPTTDYLQILEWIFEIWKVFKGFILQIQATMELYMCYMFTALWNNMWHRPVIRTKVYWIEILLGTAKCCSASSCANQKEILKSCVTNKYSRSQERQMEHHVCVLSSVILYMLYLLFLFFTSATTLCGFCPPLWFCNRIFYRGAIISSMPKSQPRAPGTILCLFPTLWLVWCGWLHLELTFPPAELSESMGKAKLLSTLRQ